MTLTQKQIKLYIFLLRKICDSFLKYISSELQKMAITLKWLKLQMTYKCQCVRVSADTVFLLSTTIIYNRVVNLKI